MRKPRFHEIMTGASRYSPARLEVRENRDVIRQAIDEGYAVKSIWRQLNKHGLVSVSYESFRLQVKALIAEGNAARTDLVTSKDDSKLDDQERLNKFMDGYR